MTKTPSAQAKEKRLVVSAPAMLCLETIRIFFFQARKTLFLGEKWRENKVIVLKERENGSSKKSRKQILCHLKKENDKIKVCPEKKHNHANYLFLPELTGNAMANISVIIWGRNRRLMIRRDRHLISIPRLHGRWGPQLSLTTFGGILHRKCVGMCCDATFSCPKKSYQRN